MKNLNLILFALIIALASIGCHAETNRKIPKLPTETPAEETPVEEIEEVVDAVEELEEAETTEELDTALENLEEATEELLDAVEETPELTPEEIAAAELLAKTQLLTINSDEVCPEDTKDAVYICTVRKDVVVGITSQPCPADTATEHFTCSVAGDAYAFIQNSVVDTIEDGVWENSIIPWHLDFYSDLEGTIYGELYTDTGEYMEVEIIVVIYENHAELITDEGDIIIVHFPEENQE